MRCCYGILFLGLFAGCVDTTPPNTSNAPVDNSTSTVNKPVINDPAMRPDATAPSLTPQPSSPDASVPPALSQGTRRDNTAVNERDQNASTKTPFDQSNTQSDVDVTAAIRQKIVNHKGANDAGMSINARNVKIITEGKQVMLRGPVSSAEEKEMIERFAKDVAGAGNVTSQLEVAP